MKIAVVLAILGFAGLAVLGYMLTMAGRPDQDG